MRVIRSKEYKRLKEIEDKQYVGRSERPITDDVATIAIEWDEFMEKI